jgi:hypothetical protein
MGIYGKKRGERERERQTDREREREREPGQANMCHRHPRQWLLGRWSGSLVLRVL